MSEQQQGRQEGPSRNQQESSPSTDNESREDLSVEEEFFRRQGELIRDVLKKPSLEFLIKEVDPGRWGWNSMAEWVVDLAGIVPNRPRHMGSVIFQNTGPYHKGKTTVIEEGMAPADQQPGKEPGEDLQEPGPRRCQSLAPIPEALDRPSCE